MWLANRYNHITVSAYNETITRGIGGNEKVTIGSSVSLNTLLVPMVKNIRYKDSGRFIEEYIILQVSKEELSNKSFTVSVGNTHVIYNGNDYKVASVLDGSFMNMVQLYQLTCTRKIPVSDLA